MVTVRGMRCGSASLKRLTSQSQIFGRKGRGWHDGAATLNSPPQLACSVDEASEATGLSLWSLRYLMKSGRLGYAKVGRRILILFAELERLLRRATVKATVPLDVDDSIRPKGIQEDAPAGDSPPGAYNSGMAGAVPVDESGRHCDSPN
jgi:excisionase family DNA binding protein